MSSNPSNDRPSSGVALASLLAGATITIVLFYLFVLSSVLLLLVVLAVDFVILLVLLRFGLAGRMVPAMQRHVDLLKTFFGCLRLGKAAEFRIALQPEDAPGLFHCLEKICRQAKVSLPHQVSLQMNVSAWVRLKGYWRGKGTTILGIGYDLLAGLSEAEVEAVLAHEMMHAKLVQRGFRQLLTRGATRAGKLANGLAFQAAAARKRSRYSQLATSFMNGADALARLAARQMAACSRQDEFAADHGAARLCGAGAIRSALLKLEGLNRIASRLPWRERVAQLESGEGFSRWLTEELMKAGPIQPAQTDAAAFNKYSTHPSLHDRLAALSAFPDQTLAETPPAIGLLAHPDRIAEKLVTAIQKEAAEQEQKDSKRLDRWSRKLRARGRKQPLQVAGWLLAGAGLVIGFSIWNSFGMSVELTIFVVLTVSAGIVMHYVGRYREEEMLPVPDYALIKAVSQKTLEVKPDQVQALESELRQRAAAGRNQRHRVRIMFAESCRALTECDYVRAHVAARFCLEGDRKSVPGTLALAVAAAGLKQSQQAGSAIAVVHRNTGMKGASPAWGAGWAMVLLGDWFRAEAFLEQARRKKPGDATVLALLAVSQARRGKLSSAILSARQACSPQPKNKEYAKLLISLLLDGGFLREASDRLQKLEIEALQDTDLMFSMLKLNLLRRIFSSAEEWIERVWQSSYGAHKFVVFGEAFEAVRQDEKALGYFHQALEAGHYPEALLGLARLEANRHNKEQARAHLLAALDLVRPPGEKIIGPLAIFSPILRQLTMLEKPMLNCRAWIAALPGKMSPPALANRAFLIYAPSREDAQKSMTIILNAMHPGAPPVSVDWRPVPREQQPDGPVCSGVQSVLA